MNKLSLLIVICSAFSLPIAIADTILLKGGQVITAGENGTVKKADVLIVDSKIAKIGNNISLPKGAKVINLTGKVLTPGFINSETSLGITEISGGANASETASNDKEFTAAYNVADIINPYSTAVPIARRGGVTSAIVAPRSSKASHYAGLAAWYTTHDANQIQWIVGSKVMYWDMKAVSSGRGATLPRLRAELADAIAFSKDDGSGSLGQYKAKRWSIFDLQALAPAIQGKIPLAFRVNRASDITAILNMVVNTNIKAVIVGGAEAWMVADSLAKAEVPVLLNPTDNLPKNFDVIHASNENASILHKAGVPIIIGGATSAHDSGKIRYFAGMAVANGLPMDIAIQAITSTPARVFNLTDVGKIETGMRADIAIWDGNPLEPLSQITALYINGDAQSLVTRQDLLEQRYIGATNLFPPIRPQRKDNKMKQLGVFITSVVCVHIALATNATAATTFIDNVTVFDSTGKAPYTSDVIIENGRFVSIGNELDKPEGAKVVSGKDLSMVAGLTDVHVHWTSSRAEVATALLEHGVTTVTDFHSSPDSYASKRKWHESLISPHVAYAARIAPPGGHGADWADERMTRLVASPEEAQKVMEYLDTYQPDVVKVFADGWRYGNPKEDTDISLHALKEITKQAKLRGWPVLTHTVSVDGGKRAALGGVSAIVHAIQDEPTSEELPELLIENHVFYAPTLAVYELRPDKLSAYSEMQIAMGKNRQAFSERNLHAFMKAGVKLALGTDSGIGRTPFGESSVHEMELMVDFGVSASDALIAGTKGSADALGFGEDRGTIEEGKRADFVLVEGSPWENISDFRNINAVFIDGERVVENGNLIGTQGPNIPTALPAKQLIDDFERKDGKTQYGTLRKSDIDYSFPRSHVLMTTKPGMKANDHDLSVAIELENKPKPKAGVIFPLSDGSFYPVDASEFNGIAFEISATPGVYIVSLDSYGGKSSITIDVIDGWQNVVLPFNGFKGKEPLDINRLRSLSISVAGKGEEAYWMELDNVMFSK